MWFDATHRMPSAEQLQKAFPADSQQVLENASSLTLLSLNPRANSGAPPNHVSGKFFYSYRVIDQTSLSSTEKWRLLRVLYDGIARPAYRAACFAPRHGIRAAYGGKTVDLVICFHCTTMLTYAGGQQSSSAISKETQPHFDGVLTSAGVPLSP